jgi:hypothetical protein
MEDDHVTPLREYVGFVWIGDEPGVRIRVTASSVDEARARVVEQYGRGHVISLWNEEDAARPR